MSVTGGIKGLRTSLFVWSIGLSPLLVTACTASPDPNQQGLPADCSATITRSEDARSALAAASPGSTVCFTGGNLADADLTMTTSGTQNSPIRLVADGATVESVHVSADDVIVEGFTVTGGDGIALEGARLAARRNTVHDTHRGGIACARCTDSTIADNTVTHVFTVGVFISGQRITVSGNTVSDTIAENDGDADGMRFFGNGHRITGNTIHDISDRGYRAPPHPDCFQTFDHATPTYDVVISGNTCRDVDAQCLIATDDQPGRSPVPPGVPTISFVDNTCAPRGSQAINLRRWAGAEIRHNKFSGPHLSRAILVADGSTNCVVTDNTTEGGVPTTDVDGSSRQGFRQSGNNPA